ncbi:MAG: hypothetical protein JSU88_05035 [Nitrospinaceae bacterium]|jgi:hypothetical protein|nr:MAG: hypothetical protein JSU88_05035 [Nitrospinaceae bacterium]
MRSGKDKKIAIPQFASTWILIWTGLAQAYIGLCCAHCGGNMPLNIPGGGIPEPQEFRFKLIQMYMQMGPLRDGANDIDNIGDNLGPPSASWPTAPSVIPGRTRSVIRP